MNDGDVLEIGHTGENVTTHHPKCGCTYERMTFRLHVGHAAGHDDTNHESCHVDRDDGRAQPLIIAYQIPLKADSKQSCASPQ